jgi:peptide/nickel transport system substrate-binding protein
MKSLRKLVIPAVATAALLVLAGCSGASKPATTSAQSHELRVAMAEVTSNLDPALYNVPANYISMSGAAGYLVSNPYKAFPYPDLYKGDAQVVDTDKAQPELATDWKLSSDGLSMTMNLRKDAKSAAGNPLTSDDVVWTVQRDIALKTVGNFGITVANLDSANPVTAEGPNTVVWHLKAPSSLLLKVLAWEWFSPIDSVEAKKHATSDDPWAQSWLKEHTAWYGPYTVTAFTPGQSATLGLNPGYYGKKPSITQIDFQSVPDAGNRQQLVQRGQVDFVPDIPRAQLSSLQNSKSVAVQLQPGTRFSYLQYRAGVKELDDKKVRQAISYAIPYDQILKDVYYGTSLAAKTPATWLPNADPTASPYTYDLKKAKQLLGQSAFPDGFSVGLTYSTANPGPENEQVAILIADSLKKIGITVNLQKPSSEAAFTTSYNAGQFDMALAGLSPGAPDSGYAVNVMGNSKGFQNFGKFSDPQFDTLLNSMLNEQDATKRAALIKQSMSMYEDLVPATPIVNPLIGMVTNPGLSDLKLGPWGVPFWKDATLSK